MPSRRALPLFCLLLLPNLSQAAWWETAAYRALFALQPFKQESDRSYEGQSPAQATLINLNTQINTWYLLRLPGGQTKGKSKDSFFNLQPMREGLQLTLDEAAPRLLISQDGQEVHKCDIAQEIVQPFARRKQPRLAYLPVCNDLLYVTISQNGEMTKVEREQGYLQRFENTKANTQSADSIPPLRASIAKQYQNTAMASNKLGLKLAQPGQKLLAGEWYPLAAGPGLYASLINPGMASPDIFGSWRDRVNGLDGTENHSPVFLMAMDLNLYSLEWGHGTRLPEVGWSKRATLAKRDNPLGPDGINSLAPLIPLGHIPPRHWHRLLGSISGGFQLRHSAFKSGELAKTNKGHHYGFMENGVLMMSPSPNLITLISYQDGRTDLRVWKEEDNAELDQIKHLRQNGVPFVEPDENGQGIPHKLVKFWTPGNWSGSADVKLRTPRGAACLIDDQGKRFLVYAYFSSATPSGIARTFQAYGCKTGIQLDMNSPGQAYASLSRPLDGGKFQIEHLMTDMFTGDTQGAPRYVIKPDYKDFFYILRR